MVIASDVLYEKPYCDLVAACYCAVDDRAMGWGFSAIPSGRWRLGFRQRARSTDCGS